MTTITSTRTPAIATTPARVGRERIARSLLWLAAAGAAASAFSAIGAVLEADSATKVVETWRAYGFVVFAGLFALLALRPRGYRGVWELVIFHKVALTVTAVGYAASGGIADTGMIVSWDGGISVLLVAAYVLSRGWTTWRRTAEGPVRG